jgi:hypothetical protein
MEPIIISEHGELKNGTNKPDRKRFTRRNVCILLAIALLILTALLFFAVNIYHVPDYNELLIRAVLAKLPASIKNLQVDTCPYMERGREIPNRAELFILFQAEQNDIKNFITDSPGIDKTKTRPLFPLSDDDQAPDWWSTDQSASGRIYGIYEQTDIFGSVFVYDDSNTVRIWMLYTVNPQLREMQDDFEDVRDACEDFVDDMLHEVLDLFD